MTLKIGYDLRKRLALDLHPRNEIRSQLRYGVTVRQAGGQQRCTGRSNPYRFVIWNHATPLASHRRGHANRRQWWAATTSRARRRHAATMRSAAAAARGGRGRAKPLRRYAQLRWSASDRQRASAPCSRVTVNREVRQDKTFGQGL